MSPSGGSIHRMIWVTYDEYDRVCSERYVTSNVSLESLRTAASGGSSSQIPSSVTSHFSSQLNLRSIDYFPFGTITYATSGDGAFTPETGIVAATDLETVRIKGFLKSESVYPAPNPDGAVSSNAPSVTRYYHYDSKGRVIQVKECWSDGRIRRISTKYSFTGDVLVTKETVVTPPPGGIGSPQESSLVTVYTRDVRGRVLSCSRVLDGTETLATVHYAYDDLGRLIGKTVGNTSNPVLETGIEYDLHGWTTGIDVAATDGVGSCMDTVFRERLYYAGAKKDMQASRYDGNISETAFSHLVVPAHGGTPCFQTNTWSYDYDGLKRLTNASHYPGAQLTASLTDTERGFDYDLNGNIEALKRYGATGLENDLTFTHTGNRMTALVDANATGNETGTKVFTYDVNGNMTADGRKGLELSWNVFNLVDSAAMHGSSLKYAWLSDGTKVAARADDGSGNGVQKRYLGSFVYTSKTGSSSDAPTEVESVAWDEGRVFFESLAVADDPVLDRGEAGAKRKWVLRPGGNRETVDSLGMADSLAWITYYRDCWFAGDHLGNIRSVIDITPGLIVPDILEQSNYLPYGMRIQSPSLASMSDNRWRYAAKEVQHFGSLDLSLLDFGARMYDPFIARWTAVDPQGKRAPGFCTYAYCGNNPVLYKELDGEVWDTFIDAGLLAYDVGSAIYHSIKGNHDAAKSSLKNAGTDLVFAIVPGASVVMVKGAKAVHQGAEMIRGGSEAFRGLKYAGEFGIDTYSRLRKAVVDIYGKGSGLEVHHLIGKRFADVLHVNKSSIPSTVLTKEEHRAFTNFWRDAIGYLKNKGEKSANASLEKIINSAQDIYKDYPEFLEALENFFRNL